MSALCENCPAASRERWVEGKVPVLLLGPAERPGIVWVRIGETVLRVPECLLTRERSER